MSGDGIKDKCEGCKQRLVTQDEFIANAHATIDEFDRQYRFFAAQDKNPGAVDNRVHEGDRWSSFISFLTGQGQMNGNDHMELIKFHINYSIQQQVEMIIHGSSEGSDSEHHEDPSKPQDRRRKSH